MKTPSPQIVDRLGIEKLASLPQASVRLLQTCNDPEAEFNTLTSIIRSDPGLASKMVHAANSPLYAQWGNIGDLNRMLVVLGLDTIKTIAITSSVLEFFRKIQPGRNHSVARFWHRSLLCAHLSRELANKTGYGNPEEAYLCGLLHKIGQLVLLNCEPEAYAELLSKQHLPAILAQQETQEFGIGHVDLGSWLVEHWKLGGFICDAILYQSEPLERLLDAPKLVVLVNMAAGLSDPARRSDCMVVIRSRLQLERPDLELLIEEAEHQVEQAAKSFDVDIEKEEAVRLADEPQEPVHGRSGPDSAADVVRNTTLLESATAAMLQQSSSQPPYPAIHTFLSILFGLDQVLFFIKAPGNILWGQPVGEHDLWLEQIHITLKPGRSLICDTFIHKKPLDTFQYESANTALNVIDRQLIRKCGYSGLLTLPLITKGKVLAVIVTGVDRTTLDGLRPQSELLRLFLNQAAKLVLQQRKVAEQHLMQQAESRAEMIRNVRKIRHEANNPLSIVSNYLHILGAKLGAENPVQQELEIVKQEIGRVSNILLELTSPFSDKDLQPGFVDLNDLVTGLHSILKPSSFDLNGIETELELDNSIAPFKADKDKLKQVVINLLKNAVEAMPDGGRIAIRTRNNVIDERGRQVEISIKDSGPGLPETVRRSLFKPVSTTKGADHAGLGLSICGQIVRKLGGGIKCLTDSKGTEFIIAIPRVE